MESAEDSRTWGHWDRRLLPVPSPVADIRHLVEVAESVMDSSHFVELAGGIGPPGAAAVGLRTEPPGAAAVGLRTGPPGAAEVARPRTGLPGGAAEVGLRRLG